MEPPNCRAVLLTALPWAISLFSKEFIPQVLMGMLTMDIPKYRKVKIVQIKAKLACSSTMANIPEETVKIKSPIIVNIRGPNLSKRCPLIGLIIPITTAPGNIRSPEAVAVYPNTSCR